MQHWKGQHILLWLVSPLEWRETAMTEEWEELKCSASCPLDSVKREDAVSTHTWPFPIWDRRHVSGRKFLCVQPGLRYSVYIQLYTLFNLFIAPYLQRGVWGGWLLYKTFRTLTVRTIVQVQSVARLRRIRWLLHSKNSLVFFSCSFVGIKCFSK